MRQSTQLCPYHMGGFNQLNYSRHACLKTAKNTYSEVNNIVYGYCIISEGPYLSYWYFNILTM